MFNKTFFSFSGIFLILAVCVLGYTFSRVPEQAAAQMRANDHGPLSQDKRPIERFWVENWIQFSFAPSVGHYEMDLDATPYDLFVNTQIALIKSPMVLEPVVRTPSIAQLPNLQTQVNPAAWIASKLSVENALSSGRRSEIYIVTFESTNPQEAEMILNAVVDSYLRYYRLLMSQQEQAIQKTLAQEKTKCEKNIQSLQAALDERLKSPNTELPPDMETADIAARLDRENRTLDQLNDRSLQLEIAQAATNRVRLLHRSVPFTTAR